MLKIERIEERVREIYRAVTGQDPPLATSAAPIPSGWNAADYVQARWTELERLVSALALPVSEPWIPRADVLVDEHGFVFEFELPGVKREEIEVGIEGGAIVVEGRRTDPRARNGWHYLWREARPGWFRRVVPVPSMARVDQLEAELNLGVLTVRLPRVETVPKDRKVEVH